MRDFGDVDEGENANDSAVGAPTSLANHDEDHSSDFAKDAVDKGIGQPTEGQAERTVSIEAQ